MASKNRATQINKVLKVVKKHYKPVEAYNDRSVLEHLLYACLLENSLHESATQVLNTLKSDYFDWNEVRVSSIRELSEAMKPLNDPEASATRLKRVLQSVFETQYSFDMEPMKKQNIGQAVKQVQKYNGSSPFTVAYITQNALGGHAVPVNGGLLEAMRVVGVISDAEAAKYTVPGLERAVPKTKGYEVGTMLHQLGVELSRSPYGPTIRKLLLEIDSSCKDNLPKRPSKKAPEPEPVKPSKKAAEKKPAAKSKAAAKSPAKKSAKPETKKKVVKKKAAAKGAKKKVVKKKKKVVKKKAAKGAKKKKKTTSRKLSRKKPK